MVEKVSLSCLTNRPDAHDNAVDSVENMFALSCPVICKCNNSNVFLVNSSSLYRPVRALNTWQKNIPPENNAVFFNVANECIEKNVCYHNRK